MKFFIALLFIPVFLFSCYTDKKHKPEVKNTGLTEKVMKADSVIIPRDSGIVEMNIVDGKAHALIHKEKNQLIYILFHAGNYSKISAGLSSRDSTANLRFNQIFLPSGRMDGPFGSEMEYTLPESGMYKISIHENMMAGDPWAGNFDVDISLSK